jgi:hypothetical protein
MALADYLNKPLESGVSPLIDAARTPKETPQSLVKIPEKTDNRLEREISELGAEETRRLTANINLTRDLGNMMIKNAEGKNLLAIREKELQAVHDRERKRIRDRLGEEYYNSPDMQEFKKFADESADKMVFVPSETTAPLLGIVFATIGATGLLLGGLSKGNAKAALSAMNGMAEGFGKGKEDLYKQERQTFDTNVKAMTQRMGILKSKLDVAREKMKYDADAADLEANAAFAEAGADFLKANKDKFGLQDSITKLETQIKQNDTWARLMATKKESAIKQLESERFKAQESKLNRDQQLTIQQILEYGREQRAAGSIESRESAARIAAGQKGLQIVIGPDGKPYQVRASDLPQLPSGQTGVTRIPSPQQPEKATIVMTEGGAASVYPSQLPIAKPGEVKGGLGAKPGEAPANVEKDIKQNALISTNMDATIESAEKLFKEGNLKSIGFLKGMVDPSLAQLYTSPNEKKFIAQMGALTNQQLKLQSGATVTAAEFARQKGVLPLRTDTPETIIVKLQQWKDLIDRETEVLGNAYPATVSKYLKPSLSQKMDEKGAAAGQSSADERSQAQAAILKAQNNKDLTPDQRQKMIDQVKAVYKRETGLDL